MKKRKIDNEHKYNHITVSASHVYNYMNNDHLVDWLRIYRKEAYSKDNFTDYICNKGNEFEEKLIDYIHKNKIEVQFVSKFITQESCEQSVTFMMQGVPLLFSVPVKNTIDNTQGIIDILIRSDYLLQLVDILSIDFQPTLKAPNLNGDYHYVVIDIKFSSLKIRSDGKHLLNVCKQPAYKSQVKIYTDAIGYIQGYTSPYGFIMGRKYIYTGRGYERRETNCFHTLGIIDYSSIDRDYIYSTQKAIDWVRLVKAEGHLWSVSPPTRIELYPNMSFDSGPWMNEKRRIAEEIKEITLVWNCNTKNRNFGIYTHRINSWNDINCSSTNLNIYGNYKPIVDSILNINRQEELNILPVQIQNNLFNWKTRENEVFIDFETISDIFADTSIPIQNATEIIFLIGVGFVNSESEFEYKKFVCNELTSQDENRIMNEFSEFMTLMNYPKLFFWAAEPSIWNRAEIRNNRNKLNLNWCDLYVVFKNEPIVIRGCLDYGLKSVAKAMKNHGMITCSVDSSSVNSGISAMLQAYDYYVSHDKNLIDNIIQYNQFDCKVLFEILQYMRTYMV
jgi:hypothetical protein